MPHPAWKISGEYAESCNCDYLCPCIYTNPQGAATHEQCTSLQVYRIGRGAYGELALDGLAFALIIRSGRVMADGNWIFAVAVDEAASEAQRGALSAIASGEAGGIPGRIREVLVGDYRGAQVAPIAFTSDALKRAVSIPGVLEFEIEGVPSRRKNGEPFYLDNTAHPANSRLALAKSTRTSLEGFGLSLQMAGKGNNGHFAPFSWSG